MLCMNHAMGLIILSSSKAGINMNAKQIQSGFIKYQATRLLLTAHGEAQGANDAEAASHVASVAVVVGIPAAVAADGHEAVEEEEDNPAATGRRADGHLRRCRLTVVDCFSQ